MKEFSNIFITNPIYWIYILLCILIIIIYYLYAPKIIGFFGELWVKQKLNKLPKDKYKIINNVLIKNSSGTHQIDHIVLSNYGIFVIETKQYNGYITGNKYDKYWIRHIGNKKINYTNPIRQNYGHIKTLSELLNINENQFFNIVCIPSKANIKIKDNSEITRLNTLLPTILSHNTIIIDNIEPYFIKINNNNITDIKSKNLHVKQVKNNINKCPECGGNLIIKTGKYGNFKGCSNYPKCKYTQK